MDSNAIEMMLGEKGIKYGKRDDGVFQVGFSCPNGVHTALIRFSEEQEFVSIRIPAIARVPVDHQRASEVYSLLLDVNYQNIFGAFGVDRRDGEVDYEACLPLDVSAGSLYEILGLCFITVDSNYPELMRKIHGCVKAGTTTALSDEEEAVFRDLMHRLSESTDEPEHETDDRD